MAGSSNNKAPEFFSVFLPEHCANQLNIAATFTPHFEKDAAGKAIIERSVTNETWEVDLVKEGEHFLFKNGWKEFVTENGITGGEFLVFQYHGNSWFTVNLFGINGLEILKPAKQPQDPALFTMRVPQTWISQNAMHLPTMFSNAYLKGQKESKVELVMPKKTWKVDVHTYNALEAYTYYQLRGKTFAAFLHENRIQVGDICVFQVIHSVPSVALTVSIIRAHESAM